MAELRMSGAGLGPRASGFGRSRKDGLGPWALGFGQRLAIAVLLAACGKAAAVPAPPGGPKGWAGGDELAKAAAKAAQADGVTVTGATAWADAARGCYALSLELSGGSAGADVAAKELLAGVASEGIAATDVVTPPAAGGTLTFALARAPYHGRVHAELARGGAVVARACFWNDREPAACEAACTEWLK